MLLKIADLAHGKTPQSLRDLCSSPYSCCRDIRDESERNRVGEFIDWKEGHAFEDSGVERALALQPLLSRGDFRAFGVTDLKEEILKLRLREIKIVFLYSFSISSFKDKARSHCGSGWAGTLYIDLIVLKLTEIPLPQPPKCWN